MKKFFLILASVAVLSSCVDMLNTSPSDEISSGNVWDTAESAEKVVNGLYQNFYYTSIQLYLNASFNGINRIGWAGMDFQAEMVADDNDIGLRALCLLPKESAVNQLYHEWRWSYTGIYRCNDFLENSHLAPWDEDTYQKHLCEARFLRAWYYSRLCKIYGGVPIYNEVLPAEEYTRTQNTAIEVWENVVEDCTFCIDNEHLPDNTLTATGVYGYGRPSRGAAYALRAQAYMYLAWENGEDNSYYQLAANDYEKVGECGYGLWAGEWEEFFKHENERDHEMIFPLQWNDKVINSDGGVWGDYFMRWIGTRDVFNCEAHMSPSFDFVTSFQYADGSTFNWADIIPEWNDQVFLDDINKREVFFFRDSVSVTSDGTVLADFIDPDTGETIVANMWDAASGLPTIQARVDEIGAAVFNKYYLPLGNEARLKKCWENRDPRLQYNVLLPYVPVDTYYASLNDGQIAHNKELRWPQAKGQGQGYVGDGADIYIRTAWMLSTYLFNKMVHREKDYMTDNSRSCGEYDWPLIRYTDVALHLAECYAHLGRYSEAVNIINQIRSRAGMPNVSAGSFDEVMNAIIYENHCEFALEGINYFDEWRWGTYKQNKFQGKDVYGEQSMWGQYENYDVVWYYTDDMYPWGAPYYECDKNPNLIRKEGWVY